MKYFTEDGNIARLSIDDAKDLLHEMATNEASMFPAEEVFMVQVAHSSGVDIDYIMSIVLDLMDENRAFNALETMAKLYSPRSMARAFASCAAEKNFRKPWLHETINCIIRGSSHCSSDIADRVWWFSKNNRKHYDAISDALIEERVFGERHVEHPLWSRRTKHLFRPRRR